MTANPKNKYVAIHTVAELDAAIKSVQTARSKTGKLLETELHGVQQRFRPVRIVSTALRQAAPYFAWSEIGLGIVRGLKGLFGGPRKKKA